MLAFPNVAALLTRPRNWNHEFAVLLSDEIFGATGRAAVCVLILDLYDELFCWFEIQANFAGWSVHGRCRFFNVLRRETNKLNLGNFSFGSSGLHHFVKLERPWICA